MMPRDLANPFSSIPFRFFSSGAVEMGAADAPLTYPFQWVIL